MVERTWKTLSLVLSLAVLAVGTWNFSRVMSYAYTTIGVIALVGLANFFILREQLRARADYLFLVLPIFFLLGLFGTIPAIASEWLVWPAALLAALLFLGYERKLTQIKVPHWLEETFSLAAGFLVFAALWGWHYYFTPPWMNFILLIIAAFFVFFWQSIYKQLGSSKNILVLSLISALVLMEIAWALLFWPVHFLTAAAASFAAFYLIYILSGYYFGGHLTRRRLVFQLIVVLFLVGFSLISSPWMA